MSKGRILVVEDDLDIADMLRIYFDSQGYEVLVAGRGGDALELGRRKLPHVVILDIMLPDIDGYEVCRKLRSNLRTSHIPIIFLTQRDKREDRIAGLELGADDYITKPFDVEELGFRIENTVARTSRERLTNPVAGLPSGKLIEEQLRLLMRKDGWAVLYIGLKDFGSFNAVYGFVAGDDVLCCVAAVVREAVEELGTPDDFIGHTAADDFVVITTVGRSQAIKEKVTDRFAAEVGTFYNFEHRERGYMTVQDPDGQERQVPLMTLAMGVITQDDGPFADTREIMERSAEARREDKELEFRVPNAVVRPSRESLTHPITGLPGGRLIEEQLRRLLFRDSWAVLYIGFEDFGSFNAVYGFVAGDNVLRCVAAVVGEAVDELGTPDDFIGHTAADDFVVITTVGRSQAIKEKVTDRFAAEVGTFYNFKHRERGYMTVQDAGGQEKQVPLMTLAVGVITQDDGPFADIREIMERAAEARREDSSSKSNQRDEFRREQNGE
jgi:PleD family two-component response regulator